jgi:fibronectin type 3 domain-containing protein
LNATPVSAVTYPDTSVLGGLTYYYVVKAVGSGGTLSVASNEIAAVVPSP